MTPLLLALLLSARPPKAPAPPGPTLDGVRAALVKAEPECRAALKDRLPPLEAALKNGATPKGRESAFERLMEVMATADATGCSDAVRLALSDLRLRLGAMQGGAHAHDHGPPPMGEVDYRSQALSYLLLAEGAEMSQACATSAKPLLTRWTQHLRGSKPAKGLVKEMKAKARALEKVCPEDVVERVEAAAVAITAAE
jgi:hypothetical protein